MCMKRVLVTGATGLIGKESVGPLLAAGFEVFAITTKEQPPLNGVHWLRGSLFDDGFVRETVASTKPTHLLNLAWATTGDYLTNDVNYRFLSAGELLARSFVTVGGLRAVYAGSCFEYRLKGTPLRECDPLESERNVYTKCKNALRLSAEQIFKSGGVSFGFGRIFYAYGRGEARTRLTGLILDHARNGEKLVIKSGPLRKDYIYAKDIANAFVALLDSPIEGVVNIGTGRTVTIREFALKLASKLGCSDMLVFEDDCATQPSCVVADTTRLTEEVGYHPHYGLEEAFDEIVRYEEE